MDCFLTDPYFSNHSYPDCLFPIMVNGRLVPCGKCRLCLLNTKKEYVLRCSLENAYHKLGYFVTLTFDNVHLSKNETSYFYFQNFLKRLRKKAKLRYFGCFEYGEKTYRPHFHAIIWTDGNITSDDICNAWWQGFADVRFVTDANIRYVVGYCGKKFDIKPESPIGLTKKERAEWRKINKYDDSVFYRGFYRFMSKGLGFAYWTNHYRELIDRGYISYHGVKYRIPRSFLNWLKKNDEEMYFVWRSYVFVNDEYKQLLKSNNYDQLFTDLQFKDIMHGRKVQKLRNYYAKRRTRCNELAYADSEGT